MDNRKFCMTVLASAALLGFGAAAQADVAATAESCNECHGVAGLGADKGVPNIAGLSEYYHADQLYFYRDGDRPCVDVDAPGGGTTNMCTIVADMSDEDIDAIAAHYAEMPFAPAAQAFDAALAEAGKAIHERDCEKCHTDGGSNIDDDAGILAGQWMPYMDMVFKMYMAGERSQDDQMKKKMDALSEDDLKALLHFYASQQ